MIRKFFWAVFLAVSAVSMVACSPVTPAAEASTGTDGSTPAVGSVESATDAVRQACRRFYGFDLDADLDQVPLAEAELRERCDRGSITWVGDCYAPRPAQFTPNEGGCAVLGGYLAVTHGAPPVEDAQYLFQVGQDAWTIRPESD